MYTQSFYITENHGNNAFSFSQRHKPRLYVPSIKNIQIVNQVELLAETSEKITFEEYDFAGNMRACFGLKHLYKLTWENTPMYIVDNHNHVYYFWYLARHQGTISDNALLYHIDEHADMRDPWEYLTKSDAENLYNIFAYTNFVLNVWNYIIPAQKEWLIWETIQIRSEQALLSDVFSSRDRVSFKDNENHEKQWNRRSVILNLDLDFFQPELDFIDYELKKKVILAIARKADIITIATSPYFMNQERAISVLRDIFFSAS